MSTVNNISENQNIKITLANFNQTVALNTSGRIYNNVYNPTFDEYDAIANVNADLQTFKNIFCFQTDYIDVNDVLETDLKYYVLADKINYFIPSLGSSIVSDNPIVSFTSTGTIQTSQVIGKDFTRYLSQLLFNTPYGTDLFVNETELVDSTSYALYTAWSHCITNLNNVSNKSDNSTIPLQGNTNAKYLTNNYPDIQNICREMFLQLISKSPSRFVNLPQINVNDEWTQSIRENSNLKYYYLPFINNDVISLRIKIYPNINQPTFGLPTTNTEKFEAINNDIRLKGRTYLINMTLSDNSTATTRLTGKFSIQVTGKNATLENLNYLPIIQTGNILNVTTKTTQINANTIQCDIFYDVDTRNSTTYSILDVGVGFSTSAITYYNANIATIEFLEFGGIPLYGKGSQFKNLLSNLIFSATDVPLVSPNTSLESAFASMPNFNENVMFLNNWNLLNVTNMGSMFSDCLIFNNGDITDAATKPLSFTTSTALTSISSMFFNCTKFNQTVSITNMEKVVTLEKMFAGCRIFNNGDITNAGTKPLTFTTSSALTTTYSIFNWCYKFNQTVTFFNMENVVTLDRMFVDCWIFNNGDITDAMTKPLTFTTTNALLYSSLTFRDCRNFNQTFTITNVENVISMESIFIRCSIFNNGYSATDNTHKLFPTKPNNITNTSYFGYLSPLANTTSNRPNWLTTSWNLI
jgi:hypothetical protein